MAASRSARTIKAALRFVGPLVLFVVIWRLPEPAKILEAIRTASPLPWVAACLLVVPAVHIKVVRWQLLLRQRGYRYPTRRAWAAYLGAGYIGMLTPGRVGDLLRVQYLRHDQDVPLSEGIASVVADRLCDLYVLGLFVAFGGIRFGSVLSGTLGMVAWGGLGVVLLSPTLLLVPGISDSVLRRIAAKVSKESGADGSDRFLRAMRAQLRPGLIPILLLTAATFGVNYVQGWLLLQALGLSVPIPDIVGLMAIASLLGLLPISVSGLGVRELFFSLAFPSLGLAAANGVSFGLLLFAVLNLILIGIGFVSFQLAPPPAGSTRAAAEQAAD